ncbi:unnamed protein product [Euphydryas editha]|uniref:Uncharacterized protein n=1 Tax=Euphydryas editha TaxID=104508 RepID=A0AAU9TLK4_EUPED|nr:unnamed protein product [Euphydryas editha]CAH2088006.1 unnamed protein product [Euphydryas editha]
MKQVILKVVFLFLFIALSSYAFCQDDATTTPTTTVQEEEEEEAPQKRSCSIWCWIQKIVMFVISQLLSGN